MAGKGIDVNTSAKFCKHCKKKVISSSDCEVCGSFFHPSCAAQAKVIQEENRIFCCKPKSFRMDENKLKAIVRDLLSEFLNPIKKKIELDMGNLKKSVQHMSDCFDEQKRVYEDVITELKCLRKENNDLKQRVDKLEAKLNLQDQKERQNNLVIVGVPKQAETETKSIMGKIFNHMNLDIKKENIEDSYRINKKDDAPIIVKFTTNDLKLQVLRKVREMKGLRTSKCGLAGDDRSIYFNDDLTQSNQNLFKKVREFRKNNRFDSAYCTDGRIYLKKEKGTQPIRIRCDEDLK